MTAQVAEKQISIERWTHKQLPLIAGQKAWKGGTAMLRPSSQAVVNGATGIGVAGANDIPIGLFNETIDNTAGGSTVLVDVDLLFERTFVWRDNDGSITKASNLYADAYVVDNQTVSATSTNRAKLGIIMDVTAADGVLVMLSTPSFALP